MCEGTRKNSERYKARIRTNDSKTGGRKETVYIIIESLNVYILLWCMLDYKETKQK